MNQGSAVSSAEFGESGEEDLVVHGVKRSGQVKGVDFGSVEGRFGCWR